MKRTLRDIFILALSGGLLTLAFPGFGVSFFAYVCVAPLVWLCSMCSTRRAFMYGLVWGYAWSLGSCFFLREIMFFIPFIFAVVLGLFSAVFASSIPFLFMNLLYPASIRREGGEAVRGFYRFNPAMELLCTATLAALWVVLEWVRTWIATGFPWNLISASQWKNTAVIQICEFTGIYGISFIVIFINIAVFFAMRGFRYSLPENKYKRPYPLLAGVVLFLLVSHIGTSRFDYWKNEYRKNSFTYTAGVVQPHLSQRRFATPDEVNEALDECVRLSEKLTALDSAFAVKREELPSPEELDEMTYEQKKRILPLDLILWPESAVPVAYYFTDFPFRRRMRPLLAAGIPYLIGTTDYREIKSETEFNVYNSAFLLTNDRPFNPDPRSRSELAASFSKMHIVPFGEYVPFGDSYPFLNKAVGMGRNLSRGKSLEPLNLSKDVRGGVNICYEDVFPYISRREALAGANLLLVVTNDAWYPVSSEPEQHYVNSLFRTIETRLPMVRCGNSNYSVYIDPFGRLVDSVGRREASSGRFENAPGMKVSDASKFAVSVHPNPPKTFYTRFGDVFVLVCFFIFMAGVATSFIRRCGFFLNVTNPIILERERIRNDFLKGK